MKKKAVCEAFEKSLGNISAACRKVGISRETFRKWMRDDPAFAQEINDASEAAIDFAETALMSNIKAGKEASIIFFLKTKGKKRGYVEKDEPEQSVNVTFERVE